MAGTVSSAGSHPQPPRLPGGTCRFSGWFISTESGLLLLGPGRPEQRIPYSEEPCFPHPHGGISPPARYGTLLPNPNFKPVSARNLGYRVRNSERAAAEPQAAAVR